MNKEEKKSKLYNLFSELTQDNDIKIMINNRKWLLSHLIEMFGRWNKEGDCIPEVIQLGANSKNYAYIQILTSKKLAKTLKEV